jgi:hypothetical protein
MKEVYRDRRGLPSVNSLLQDLRYTVRALLANRTFTAVAVFSVINAMMIRPLAAREPGQLVVLSSYQNDTRFLVFNPEFEELRVRQRSLTGMFAVSERPSSGSKSPRSRRPISRRAWCPATTSTFSVSHRHRGASSRSPMILDYPGEQERPFTIVGVVRDSHYNSLRETETGPMAWMPLAQAPFPITSISLRVTPGTEGRVTREASRVLSSIDPYVMVRRTTTLDRQVQSTVVRERLLLNLSSSFGLFALLLAAVGLHGTLSYAVAHRRREFGIRLALGAQRRSVVAMFLHEAAALSGVAIVVGVPLALLTGSMLTAFLFGVAPQDPATLAVACGVLGISVVMATAVPAFRASRIDPAETLRSE